MPAPPPPKSPTEAAPPPAAPPMQAPHDAHHGEWQRGHGHDDDAMQGPSHEEMRLGMAQKVVTVTVDSGAKNAILERKVLSQEGFGHVAIALPFHTNMETWEQICVAPCKVELFRASSYRVATGNGMPGTKSFTLAPNRETLDLRVKPGNFGAFATGGVLTGVGIGALVTGAVLVTVAGKFKDESEVRTVGAVTGAAGLVLMAIGIPLMILNQTHVYDGSQQLARRRPSTGPKLGIDGLSF